MSTLSTERLELVPWSTADEATLAGLALNPRVVRYIGDGRPWTEAQIAQVSDRCVAHWTEHGFGWRVAVERASGDRIGFIGLNYAGEGAGIDPTDHEIGWWLAPASWGQGLAREGAAAVCNESFTRVGAPSVVARIQPDNRASLEVAAAIGLTPEGTSRGRLGEAIAVLRLTAERWASRDWP